MYIIRSWWLTRNFKATPNSSSVDYRTLRAIQPWVNRSSAGERDGGRKPENGKGGNWPFWASNSLGCSPNPNPHKTEESLESTDLWLSWLGSARAVLLKVPHPNSAKAVLDKSSILAQLAGWCTSAGIVALTLASIFAQHWPLLYFATGRNSEALLANRGIVRSSVTRCGKFIVTPPTEIIKRRENKIQWNLWLRT